MTTTGRMSRLGERRWRRPSEGSLGAAQCGGGGLDGIISRGGSGSGEDGGERGKGASPYPDNGGRPPCLRRLLLPPAPPPRGTDLGQGWLEVWEEEGDITINRLVERGGNNSLRTIHLGKH